MSAGILVADETLWDVASQAQFRVPCPAQPDGSHIALGDTVVLRGPRRGVVAAALNWVRWLGSSPAEAALPECTT